MLSLQLCIKLIKLFPGGGLHGLVREGVLHRDGDGVRPGDRHRLRGRHLAEVRQRNRGGRGLQRRVRHRYVRTSEHFHYRNAIYDSFKVYTVHILRGHTSEFGELVVAVNKLNKPSHKSRGESSGCIARGK